MKIICIGRNYAEHAKEMKSEVPKEPVFFMKPDTAILKNNDTFYLPDFSNEIHHEVEIILKINKPGKNIDEKFAHKYFDEISVGVDFTARDIQAKCKEKGLPWEKAKAFDGSAPTGIFINKNEISDLKNFTFKLEINNKIVQQGNTKDLLFYFDYIISYVSTFITLKTGDLIFTGTPEGVGPVNKGDTLNAYIEDKKLLTLSIK